MIGVSDRWAASFTVGGDELCNTDEFAKFKLEETAGNVLPQFELHFKTSEPDRVLAALNEKTIISAGIGVEAIQMGGISLRPLKKEIARAEGGTIGIVCKGMTDRIQYMTKSSVDVSQKTSAIKKMQEVVSRNFSPEFDTSSSNDNQVWIQHGISDKNFVQQLWTHADLGQGNFPMVAIEASNTFRLRTADKMKGSAPNWYFGIHDIGGTGVIKYNSDYLIVSNTGLMNYWQGYQKSAAQINIDEGMASEIMSSISSFASMSGGFEMSGDAGGSSAETLVLNENTHKMFHQSAKNNVGSLAVQSSTTLTLSVTNQYFPIRVLDLAYFADDVNTGGIQRTIEAYSGIWIVTGVTRTIDNWRFKTVVTMVRESMNTVTGNN